MIENGKMERNGYRKLLRIGICNENSVQKLKWSSEMIDSIDSNDSNDFIRLQVQVVLDPQESNDIQAIWH